MAYNYVVTSQKATVVTHSLVCAFTSARARNLLVCKQTHLEVYALAPDGLIAQYDLGVFGRVHLMQAYHSPGGGGRDAVFLLTEALGFCALEYDADTAQVVTLANGSVKDRNGMLSASGPLGAACCFFSSDGAGSAGPSVVGAGRSSGVIVLHLYDGVLKVLPIDGRAPTNAFNVRLLELVVLDMQMAVVRTDGPEGMEAHVIVYVLHEDNQERRYIKSYVLNIAEKTLQPANLSLERADPDAGVILPLPSAVTTAVTCSNSVSMMSNAAAAAAPENAGEERLQDESLLVLGAEHATVVSTSSRKPYALDDMDLCAYGFIDDTRLLLSDTRGDLFLLELSVLDGRVAAVAKTKLGRTSIASTISYLDSGVVFVGSVYGDSLLIRLRLDGDEEKEDTVERAANEEGEGEGEEGEEEADDSKFEIIQTFDNVGPIIDMCVLDDEQGQSQAIVTCSGGYQDGSVRIVRSGIGINEQASTELEGIKGIWSLRPSSTACFEKYLVQSFVSETRILAIEDEELSELEDDTFAAETTLFCGNARGDLVFHVTPRRVRLLAADTLQAVHEWRPESADDVINVATANYRQCAVALTGGRVVCLEVNAEERVLTTTGELTMGHDVAALNLNPFEDSPSSASSTTNGENEQQMETEVSGNPDADADADEYGIEPPTIPDKASNLLAVALWTEMSVVLYALPSLEEIARIPLGVDTQARSILLVTLSGRDYLMVGLGDGSLITYTLETTDSSSVPTMGQRRTVPLATHPISLSLFRSQGQLCVFAASDRPSVAYAGTDGQLLYSSVNLADVSGMAPFGSQQFPGCLAFGQEAQLLIGTVDNIQKLHIETVPMEEQPRRIAHCPDTRLLCVCLTHTDVYDTREGDILKDRVAFYDQSEFYEVFSMDLQPNETIFSCARVRLEASETRTSAAASAAAAAAAAATTGGAGDSAERGPAGSLASAQEYVIVGTGFTEEDVPEPRRGRLLVFGVELDAASTGGRSGGDEKEDEGGSNERDEADDVADGQDEFGARRIVSLLCEQEVRGAVFSISEFSGKVLTGVGTRVRVYKWVCKLKDSYELQQECSHGGHIMALYTRALGDFIVVGDFMRSLTLLKYNPLTCKLQEVSRDFNTNYMRSAELYTDELFLGAEDHGNLFVMRRLADASTDEERKRLELQGEFHLGDDINVFRKGTLSAQHRGKKTDAAAAAAAAAASNADAAAAGSVSGTPSAGARSAAGDDGATDADAAAASSSSSSSSSSATEAASKDASASDSKQPAAKAKGQDGSETQPSGPAVRSCIMYGCASGAIGSILSISKEAYEFFHALENGMRQRVKGLGGFSHEEFRKFHNGRREGTQRAFVDGDLVEQFLLLPREQADAVVELVNDSLIALHGQESPAAANPLSHEDVVMRVEEMTREH